MAQAEALVSEVHRKEKELEGLSGLWKRLERNSSEVNATRNRFGRSIFDKGSASSDYIVDVQHKPLFTIGRWDSLQRPALPRSDIVCDSPTDSLRVARDNGLGNADAGVGGFSDNKFAPDGEVSNPDSPSVNPSPVPTLVPEPEPELAPKPEPEPEEEPMAVEQGEEEENPIEIDSDSKSESARSNPDWAS
ncbi:hypothetical protein NL676_030290 [Syzygium grande]|nr:hypothetical protein NL676_030290 [Syzygium grande]